jgi:hypothetical protein
LLLLLLGEEKADLRAQVADERRLLRVARFVNGDFAPALLDLGDERRVLLRQLVVVLERIGLFFLREGEERERKKKCESNKKK